MQIWQIVLGLAVMGSVGMAVGVRLYPIDPAANHVDPSSVSPPTSPNFILLRGEDAASLPVPMDRTATRLTDVVGREGGVLLAGDLAQGHASYVFRSTVFGFPDVLSVRLSDASGRERLPEGSLTEIEIFSRALMGHSDLGVNRARVDRLLAALDT